MGALTSFITNLIIYILLAVILDMLVPNSSFRKYTKLVIGLILVAILLAPVLNLFKADLPLAMEQTLAVIGRKDTGQFDAKITDKKSEINQADRAYTLEQMAVQLKRDAEGELMATFQYQVTGIRVEMKDKSSELKAENIKSIAVQLRKSSKNHEIEMVEPVDTSFHSDNKVQTTKEVEISDWLTKRWALSKDVVTVTIAK